MKGAFLKEEEFVPFQIIWNVLQTFAPMARISSTKMSKGQTTKVVEFNHFNYTEFEGIKKDNMKTIEERARDYAPNALDADFIVPVREGYIVKEQRLAYKQGATEQKAIDDAERDTAVYNLLQLKLDNEKKLWLDKACEWLMKYFVFDNDGMSASGCDVFLRNFRKAMKK